MRGQEFRARDKKVQKLGRDGLVEQNKATGEERRVSQRTADMSFGPERKQDQQLGRQKVKKSRKQRSVRSELQSLRQEADKPAPHAEGMEPPEGVEEPLGDHAEASPAEPEAKPVIRDTRDVPAPPPSRTVRQRNHRPRDGPAPKPKTPADHPTPKRWQEGQRHTGGLLPELTDSHEPPPQGRLHFEDGAAPAPTNRTPGKRRVRPSIPAGGTTPAQFENVDPSWQGGTVDSTAPEIAQHSDGIPPPDDASGTDEHSKPADTKAEPPPQGRLHFEDTLAPVTGHPKSGGSSPPPKQGRLRFEDAPVPEKDGELELPHRQQRRYEKAERRVEQASRKLEKAQEKIPTKRRAHLEKQYDSESGKVRRHLRFEKEAVPENAPPALPKRVGGAVVRTAQTTAVLKAHQKLREAERDNTGVEAAHKVEFVAERGAGRFLRWNKNRLHSKPYRAVRQAQSRLQTEQTRLAWQTALRDHPELQRKSALSKWYQKQKIKRKYAQAAREAQKTAQHTQNVLTTTGKIVRAVAQAVSAHKTALAFIALLALVVMLFSTGLSSCTAMLSSFQSTYIATTYLANEQDICNSDLYYTELETDLQINIDDTETNYPGYDEYRYNIGEISHNPYVLMGYLSAAYDAFTFEQVKPEIERLFGQQYTLTRTPITETRYDDNEEPYEWTVLQTTLTVRPLSQVIAASLTPGDQTDRYGVYMQTYGNRQAYGNPFDFPWLGYVSSSYGYRVHPIDGGKNLHRGVDIAVAQGTAIHAIQDGRVVSAGDAGSYGLCIVIEDDKGYQSRYAHCSSISVTAGQEVKRGDVIAVVGSTGNSTGPHLHLEVMLNGEYLNPFYFVDTGDDGTGSAIPGAPGGVEIPDYPGEPVTDETYAAMLAEAQKYLGYPYVWGGSSPSTSFDCSGFVSWVVNHSGWSVGRLGAQGLYNICTPVSAANVQPGDLVFFWHTYDAPNPNGVTHVGIYVGNGQMIHCGDPISYANINTNYWTQHFYAFGRMPTQ